MNTVQLQNAEVQLSEVADQLKTLSKSVATVTQNLALVLAKLERSGPEVAMRNDLRMLSGILSMQTAVCSKLLQQLVGAKFVRALDEQAALLRDSSAQAVRKLRYHPYWGDSLKTEC